MDQESATASTRCCAIWGPTSGKPQSVYVIPEPFVTCSLPGLVGGGFDLIDLIAIDIQRPRDVGLGHPEPDQESAGPNYRLWFGSLN